MSYFQRKITPIIHQTLQRGKSVLLLGPRQTGKTTLIREEIKPDLFYSFIQPRDRLRYEQNPSVLGDEILAEIKLKQLNNPIVAIDEVQKIPSILDVVQDLIDRKIARFILTGSSARKLKRGHSINLLPGRVVLMHLDPLLLSELETLPSLESLLLFGSLPGVFTEASEADKNRDLDTYVKTYLEEEVRSEALVRNIGHFSRFLYLSAAESGRLINLSQLSQTIGVNHTTIANYFEILEDCLIMERIDPLLSSHSRRRLSKASKYLFFDLGIRRLCAEEGTHLPLVTMGHLFEQFVGLELIRKTRLLAEPVPIRYWRDHDGPEIDYVIEHNQNYIPIEVKWTDKPIEKDFRHLNTFLKEYDHVKMGYIICRIPRPILLAERIMALPWQMLDKIEM